MHIYIDYAYERSTHTTTLVVVHACKCSVCMHGVCINNIMAYAYEKIVIRARSMTPTHFRRTEIQKRNPHSSPIRPSCCRYHEVPSRRLRHPPLLRPCCCLCSFILWCRSSFLVSQCRQQEGLLFRHPPPWRRHRSGNHSRH